MRIRYSSKVFIYMEIRKDTEKTSMNLKKKLIRGFLNTKEIRLKSLKKKNSLSIWEFDYKAIKETEENRIIRILED